MDTLDPHRLSTDALVSSGVFVSSKHRSDVEVSHDVLEAIRHGAYTRLMSVTYLTIGKVEQTLGFLVKHRLVSEDPLTRTYEITEEGRGFPESATGVGNFE